MKNFLHLNIAPANEAKNMNKNITVNYLTKCFFNKKKINFLIFKSNQKQRL